MHQDLGLEKVDLVGLIDLLDWWIYCFGFAKFWKMPSRRLDPREMDDLSDAMEERISEKIREEFRSEIALMKSDMISEIVSALGGVPRHMGIEGSYEEVAEDFEVVGLSGKDKNDRVERPIGIRAGRFA